MQVEMIEAELPVIRCAACGDAYTLVAPIMPARWIYQQPPKCKRAKHPLAVQSVELDAAETLPVKVLVPLDAVL